MHQALYKATQHSSLAKMLLCEGRKEGRGLYTLEGHPDWIGYPSAEKKLRGLRARRKLEMTPV